MKLSWIKACAIAACVAGTFSSRGTATPMDCQAGEPRTVQTGFYPSAGDPKLSCVAAVGGCVDRNKCPQLSPPYCAKGQYVQLITGFYSTGGGLSCPNYQGACVDSNGCPSGGSMLCQKGHAVYLTIGFIPNPKDPNLKCKNEIARCVDDYPGCPAQ